MMKVKQVELQPGKLYYSIGEVSKLLDVEPTTLRFWERSFPQLKLKKTQGGRRQYTPEDIRLLQEIHYWIRIEGISIEQARFRVGKMDSSDATKMQAIARLTKAKQLLQKIQEKI